MNISNTWMNNKNIPWYCWTLILVSSYPWHKSPFSVKTKGIRIRERERVQSSRTQLLRVWGEMSESLRVGVRGDNISLCPTLFYSCESRWAFMAHSDVMRPGSAHNSTRTMFWTYWWKDHIWHTWPVFTGTAAWGLFLLNNKKCLM